MRNHIAPCFLIMSSGILLNVCSYRKAYLDSMSDQINVTITSAGVSSVSVPQLPRAPRSIEKTELRNQYYGHGAFMGCANELWNTKEWNAILQALMPDVHSDVSAAIESGESMATVIPMFENNPITAAYGALLATGTAASIFEWDAFFDPSLVKMWRKSTDAVEKKRLVASILDTMLIAHGGTAETVKENKFGLHQYGNIRGLRKTEMGGLLARDWMDIFARALVLAKGKQPIDTHANAKRVESTDEATKYVFLERQSFKVAVEKFKGLTDAASFAVALDLKHYSNARNNFMPELLDSLIEVMNENGIRVEAVGNFDFHKFPNTDSRQMVAGLSFDAAKKIKFFHHVGGLQKQLDSPGSSVDSGDIIFFNAAYLVKYKSVDSAKQLQKSMSLDLYQMGSLAVYQKFFNLNLGVYVQENNLCPGAYETVAKAVNEYPDIFNFGFAWGGVKGKVPDDIKPLKYRRNWKIPLGAGVQSSRFCGRKKWDPNESRNTLFREWTTSISRRLKQSISTAIAKHVGVNASQVLDNVLDNKLPLRWGRKKRGACVRAWLVPGVKESTIEFSLWMGKKTLSKWAKARANCATPHLQKVAFNLVPLSNIARR